ncbi:MAG: hypothetical protein AB1696_08730 [Planctomycetota bacterium]
MSHTALSDSNETNRQIEHIIPVGFAVFLRWLPPWGAIAIGCVGVAYAAFVSPWLVSSGLRPHERSLRFIPAKLYYAFAVLLLLIVFRHSLHIAAGAWAMLSVGDGVASLAGARWGGNPLPWNRRKTWGGLAAFVLTGWASAAVLLVWVGARYSAHAMSLPHATVSAFIAALLTAFVESAPLGQWIDDNLSVPLVAGLILAILT